MARTSVGLIGFASPFQVASTPPAGFALQNGTPTILSFTTPNVPNTTYLIVVAVRLHVTSAMTGGTTGMQITESGQATDSGGVIFAAEGGAGYYHYPNAGSVVTIGPFLVGPNCVVSLVQASALTAGAATIDAVMQAVLAA